NFAHQEHDAFCPFGKLLEGHWLIPVAVYTSIVAISRLCLLGAAQSSSSNHSTSAQRPRRYVQTSSKACPNSFKVGTGLCLCPRLCCRSFKDRADCVERSP